MSRGSLLTVIVLAFLVAVVVYASMGLSAYECEVCVAFGGRQACGSVAGASEREARTSAMTNVCARLASGMTESMRCQQTVPFRVDCGGSR